MVEPHPAQRRSAGWLFVHGIPPIFPGLWPVEQASEVYATSLEDNHARQFFGQLDRSRHRDVGWANRREVRLIVL
jgi:hypothetical protein